MIRRRQFVNKNQCENWKLLYNLVGVSRIFLMNVIFFLGRLKRFYILVFSLSLHSLFFILRMFFHFLITLSLSLSLSLALSLYLSNICSLFWPAFGCCAFQCFCVKSWKQKKFLPNDGFWSLQCKDGQVIYSKKKTFSVMKH